MWIQVIQKQILANIMITSCSCGPCLCGIYLWNFTLPYISSMHYTTPPFCTLPCTALITLNSTLRRGPYLSLHYTTQRCVMLQPHGITLCLATLPYKLLQCICIALHCIALPCVVYIYRHLHPYIHACICNCRHTYTRTDHMQYLHTCLHACMHACLHV